MKMAPWKRWLAIRPLRGALAALACIGAVLLFVYVARPVATHHTVSVDASDDDTWESIATRSMGGAEHAGEIRALNGVRGAEKPVAGRSYKVARPIALKPPDDVLHAIKGAIAFGALGLSVYAAFRLLQKRPVPTIALQIGGGLLAAASVWAFLASDSLRPEAYHHDWDQFHYYMGSKYAKELSYKRIYACAAVAENELGYEATARTRKLRDLESNVLVPAKPIVDNPDAESVDIDDPAPGTPATAGGCGKSTHFTPERWDAFKQDINWFCNHEAPQYWQDMNHDHGYNAPPVWTMTGHIIASLAPASEKMLSRLAAIDLVLLGVAFYCIWWAFGWRVVCVALILFGAQYPANGFFTAGAFLRQDWLLFLVLSACLVRKKYYALGGAALAWSALLRVFPALFFAGWVVMAVVYVIRHKRVARAHKRLFAGAAIAAALLVPASVAVTGTEGYKDFVNHIRLHTSTPLTNNMGLPQMIAYSEDGREKNAKNAQAQDPYSTWANIYRQNTTQRRWVFLAIVGGLGVLFVAVAMRLKTLWVAEALGLLLVTMLLAPTCYYYGFFLLAAVLSRAQRRIEWACFFVGGMSAWLLLFDRIARWDDDRYYWQSALFVGFALFLVLAFARASKPKRVAKKPALAGGSADAGQEVGEPR